jgi:type I restriction enzyme S subunit
LQEGDILIEISGGGPDQPVGRTVLIDKSVLSFQPEVPKICTNFLRLARPSIYVDPKYLNLFLTFFYKSGNVVAYQGGSNNLRNLKFDDYTSIKVPLAPLAEQHRIVAKIEELFSALDKGIESLKTAQQQLKVYRQAVLKYAFEGKLTNPEVREGELPEGWEVKALSQVGIWRGGGTPSKSNPSFWLNGTIDWVTAKDMKSDIILSTLDRITPESLKFSSAKLIPANSVLIVVRSGILRRTLPVALVAHQIAINQDMQALTPHSVDSKYLFHCLKAFAETIRKECSKDGTTVESIDTTNLKRFLIPIAPSLEQVEIVQEIESRLSVCDKIEESIAQSLQQAEALRQSILRKAFEGRLVPQDPNDEPASVLLERIRAARAAAQPVQKQRIKKAKA